MNIILTGFMGAGKSVVGRELARRLGMPFVDMDCLIAEREGRSISSIFHERGEGYFRRCERQLAIELSHLDEQVVATGGGVMLNEDNVASLQRSGIIVYLKAQPSVIRARTKGQRHRPLLTGDHADGQKRIEALLRERSSCYRQADTTVDTSNLTVPEVVEEIAGRVQPKQLQVHLGPRSYQIHVGASLRQTGTYLQRAGLQGRVLVVSDTKVCELYGAAVCASLSRGGFAVETVRLARGERAKSLFQAKKLYYRCVEAKLDRTSCIVALGGGVVGDLAGFVAATFMRGVNFVILPTSLLSQLDSSVGGKVAVNLPQGKNLVGAFYQPRLVLADPLALRTLAPRRIREGLAEALKGAIVADKELFYFLERHALAARQGDVGILQYVLARAIQLKIRIVEADEREERGVRQLLNLGHTLGHAIETTARYGTFTHGEAVAVGMLAAFRLAERLGLCPAVLGERVRQLLVRLRLPTGTPGLDAGALCARLRVDKKVRQGRLVFVLPRGIGNVSLEDDIPEQLVREAVEEMVQ